ncbi:NfeD family protein [Amycolatopsis endophytica]|uniref:Membrane protein implicated in regulation of membrane protease activity n=1 Tax=Amycolatopsis endophytica TaxID=860233 RepID=A0A853B9B7_9PSEU|nr:NfeD family protein [Amycolatopsis endophytica]NYI91903.1 membrane protein implicated in regulation of membrane protease activity [Amycolatopsis endophytica]
MDAWLAWLVFACALGIAEIFSLTAALGVLGGAALVTAGSAAAGLSLPFQLVVFVAAATAGLAAIAPVARRHLRAAPASRFGVDALIGSPAAVTGEISAVGGTVRIGGEEWSARAYDDTLVIRAGTIVDVLGIQGTTALVHPREEPWTSPPL